MATQIIDSDFFHKGWGTQELRAIFEDKQRLQYWLDIEAALAAVPRFRIRPGTRNGVPQSGVVVQPIRFSMPPVAEGGAPGAAQPAEEQVQR